MAYLGNTPTSQSFTSGTDYFSGTGSQTAFTLTRTVNSVNDIEVVINNVVQQPSTAYTLSGTTVTFTSAPSSGTNNIYVRYLATNMQSFTVSANSIDKSKLSSDLQAGFQGRNRIINGHMVVDQRNAGASGTGNGYTVDRFQYYGNQSSKFTWQQNAGSVTPPVGFKNYLGFTSSSAYSLGSSDQFVLYQPIEGYNIADLAWGTANAKTVTLSFKVYSSLTGTFGGVIRNDGSDRVYPFTYSVTAANTWTTATVTIAGDTTGTWLTNNSTGMTVLFSLGAGSSNLGTAGAWSTTSFKGATGQVNVVGTSGATFYITGVQLEEGTTATSFEREIYSTTLQKCQRYYWKTINPHLSGVASSSTAVNRLGASFPVTMRAVPTVTYSGTIPTYDGSGTGTITSATSVYSNLSFFEMDAPLATGTTAASRAVVSYLDAAITGNFSISAEL